MKNYIQPGDNPTITATANMTSGTFYLIGALTGVAQATVLSGEEVVLVRKGVFELPKATGQAWTQGAKLYWSAGNSNFTTTATGNTLVGVAAAAAASGDTVGLVLLDGAIR